MSAIPIVVGDVRFTLARLPVGPRDRLPPIAAANVALLGQRAHGLDPTAFGWLAPTIRTAMQHDPRMAAATVPLGDAKINRQ
jgi:hypothetical protein